MPRKNLRNHLVREVELKLERLKKLPDVLDEEMSVMAQDIRQTAKNMAPIDYGGLKHSIKVRRTAGTRKGIKGFIKGKSSFLVYIDPTAPAIGRKENFVGEYVWLVHEHMGYGDITNVIMPSAKSVAAAAAHGEIAGGKFLDRAMNKHRGKIHAKLSRTTRKFINQADFMANRVDK